MSPFEVAFYETLYFRDYLEERLDIETLMNLLFCSKTLYGSFGKTGAALETSPPRKEMLRLFWSRYVMRPSISINELRRYIQHARWNSSGDGIVQYALKFQFQDRLDALYFYVDYCRCTIKLYYNLKQCGTTTGDFKGEITNEKIDDFMQNLWLWLINHELVDESDRLGCSTFLSRDATRINIHRLAFDQRILLANERRTNYLKNPLWPKNTIKSVDDALQLLLTSAENLVNE